MFFKSTFVEDKESMEPEHGEPTHFKVAPEENADELEDDDVTEPDKGMDFGESIHFDRTPEIMPAEKDRKVNVADMREPSREPTFPYSASAPMNESKEKGRVFEHNQGLLFRVFVDDLEVSYFICFTLTFSSSVSFSIAGIKG